MSMSKVSRIHSGTQRCRSRSEEGSPSHGDGGYHNLEVEVNEGLKKRFLEALSKVPELWDGKRKKQNPGKWVPVSRKGGFKDVIQARQVYSKIRMAIDYRIRKAEAEGKLSKELLEACGPSILQEFYNTYRYELWPDAEFLTKAMLSKRYGVDLSGSGSQSGGGKTNPNNPRGMNGGRPVGTQVRIPPAPASGIFPDMSLYLQRQMGQPQAMGMENYYQPQPHHGGNLNMPPRPSARTSAATATVTSQQQQFEMQHEGHRRHQQQHFQQPAQTPSNGQHYMNAAQGGFMDSNQQQQQEELYEQHGPGFDRMEFHSMTQLKEELVDEDTAPPQSLRNPLELYYQGSPLTGTAPEQSYGVSQMEVNRRIQHFSDFLTFIKKLDKDILKMYSQHFMQLSAVANQLVVDEGLPVNEVRQKLEKMQLRLSEISCYSSS